MAGTVSTSSLSLFLIVATTISALHSLRALAEATTHGEQLYGEKI